MPAARTCYFCGSVATSDEHVPPKAVFPKPKDSPDGRDYRLQLIKVPACDLHNSATSKDDEYLLYVATMSLTANSLGTHHFLTKVRRAIDERPALIRSIVKTAQRVHVHDRQTGKEFPTYGFEVDGNRLDVIFEKIARGIHFHETGGRWPGEVVTLVETELSLEDREVNRLREGVVRSANTMFNGVPHSGANPDAFSYQRRELPNGSVIRMHFYGAVRVVATLAS